MKEFTIIKKILSSLESGKDFDVEVKKNEEEIIKNFKKSKHDAHLVYIPIYEDDTRKKVIMAYLLKYSLSKKYSVVLNISSNYATLELFKDDNFFKK